MEKIKNKNRLYVLIALTLLSTIIVSVTIAKYSSRSSSSASTTVALYINEINNLEIPITDVKPRI